MVLLLFADVYYQSCWWVIRIDLTTKHWWWFLDLFRWFSMRSNNGTLRWLLGKQEPDWRKRRKSDGFAKRKWVFAKAITNGFYLNLNAHGPTCSNICILVTACNSYFPWKSEWRIRISNPCFSLDTSRILCFIHVAKEIVQRIWSQSRDPSLRNTSSESATATFALLPKVWASWLHWRQAFRATVMGLNHHLFPAYQMYIDIPDRTAIKGL